LASETSNSDGLCLDGELGAIVLRAAMIAVAGRFIVVPLAAIAFLDVVRRRRESQVQGEPLRWRS
jgi:hypothetical protein